VLAGLIYVQKLHGFRNEFYRAVVTANIGFLTVYFTEVRASNQGCRNEFYREDVIIHTGLSYQKTSVF